MRGNSIIAMAVLLTACERVVDIDLNEGPKRLVVEARLEYVLERPTANQHITLSRTGAYFDASAPPAVRSADVLVTDDAGGTYRLVEGATPGRYETNNLMVVAGRRYTLRINAEGNRYESTERAVTVAPVDSLTFERPRPGRFSGTDGVRATIYFEEPGGERNFYLWDQYVDGVRQLGPDSSFKMRIISNDDGFDGLPINGFQPFEGIDIKPGNTVVLRQIGLSETLYRYFFAFSDQVGSDGSPFGVPPASLRGNVANLTDPRNSALGYFSVAQVSERRSVYPR